MATIESRLVNAKRNLFFKNNLESDSNGTKNLNDVKNSTKEDFVLGNNVASSSSKVSQFKIFLWLIMFCC